MENKNRHTYRICPCSPMDVEGIQSWLEELARDGLVLETDGSFCGIFTFRKETAKTIRYRLTPVQKKQGFWEDSQDPSEEEMEYSAQCGWEYVVRWGSFHIYRADNPNARPLHTDPAVQAMAIDTLRKQQRHLFISELIYWTILILLRSNGRLSLFLTAAVTGPVHVIGLIGAVLWAAGTILIRLIRLSRYRKRILQGDRLETPRNWKKAAPKVLCTRLLPWILAAMILIPLGVELKQVSDRVPLKELGTELPFATMTDIFPDAQLDHSRTMGDYNTAVQYTTGVSRNTEWSEAVDITAKDGDYYGILRLKCFDTVSSQFAKLVQEDIYARERARYHGKRFEDIPSPETGFDSVKVFDSYGSLHILIHQENKVFHAVVVISNHTQENHWVYWLRAMEEKLL